MALSLLVALVFSVFACLVSFIALIFGFVAALRSDEEPSRWNISLKQIRLLVLRAIRDPAIWSCLVLVGSLALPWVRGSVAGIYLPRSIFSYPWISWVVVLPTLIVIITLLASQIFNSRWVRLGLTFGFFMSTILGALVLILAAAAQKVSHYSLVLDTLLRGVGHASVLLPALRVGPGVILFTLIGVTGTVSSAVRRSSRVVKTELSTAEADAMVGVPSPDGNFLDGYFRP
jgi:hypothetical protein